MSQLASCTLELRNMPVGIQQFSYTVGEQFFRQMESADIRSGEVSVTLTAERKDDLFDLTFQLEGEIVIGCDRCLDDLAHRVSTTYHTVVKYGDCYNEDNDEEIIVPEGERSFDLSRLIYDSIALTVPLKHVHSEGECNAEMLARLKEYSASDEEQKPTDSRWEALRNILDNDK